MIAIRTFAILTICSLLSACAGNNSTGVSTSVGVGFGRSISSNASVGVGINAGPLFRMGSNENRASETVNSTAETQPDNSTEKAGDIDSSSEILMQ